VKRVPSAATNLGCLVLVTTWCFSARATTVDESDDLQLHPLRMTPSPWKDFRLTLDGYLRVRGELWNDLDLSRGPTPTTGQPIFPTPLSGADDHTLTAADMRVRLEPTLEIGQAVRLHLRVDVLDNIGWGSTPEVLPSGYAFASQNTAVPMGGVNSLKDAIAVKQAWGEVVLPFGVLAAGRMDALISWGTGFFVNNGDCLDCDHGDSGDRVALTLPILSHYLTVLYELTSSGAGGFARSATAQAACRPHTSAIRFFGKLPLSRSRCAGLDQRHAAAAVEPK
jgi:uncharacterized protein (TIGR04551 family)